MRETGRNEHVCNVSAYFEKELDSRRLRETAIVAKGREERNGNLLSIKSSLDLLLIKLIKKSGIDHLEHKNFDSKHQCGFSKGNSNFTNLVEFYDKTTTIKQDREGWIDCIFLDCQKAFAIVLHKRLL
ncbi:uncharacterized protein [Procambarus clarkii]|uniref:uncharacterized protein n=1 Tax=Procambarus clarkii TaxID=6728 RepID=UPI001E674BCD|nr:uncharacterized protein LOC123750581 [Procambarus clarkii]